MTEFRSYRNDDAPAIAAIWREQEPHRALLPVVTAAMLEQHVFAKPYFDPRGLIIACDPNGPVGFIHAGFGPDDEFQQLSHDIGVLCMVMTSPRVDRELIGRELVGHAENYLRSLGATTLIGGPIHPVNPFYLGMYGGSELPGVLESDVRTVDLLRGCGYEEFQRTVVLQRDLAGFRPSFDRSQMQVRRTFDMQTVVDPVPGNWWEACTVAQSQRTRCQLVEKESRQVRGRISHWNMEPLASNWDAYAAGLTDLEIERSYRRRGLATFLVGETLRQLQTQGVSLVEVQTMLDNTAALAMYEKFGFRNVEQGIVFRKVL